MNNIILVGAMFMVLSPISLSFDSDYPDPFVLPNAANVTDVDGDVDGDAKDRYTAWCHVSNYNTTNLPVVFMCSSTSHDRV